MTKAVLISLLSVVYTASVFTPLQAQNVAALMQQAQAFEKAFKDDDALKKYVKVLK